MMLQKIYSAYSDNLENQQLFIELGLNHLACWCKKDNEQKFTAFEFFQCDKYDASGFENLINSAKLHSKLLQLDADKTILCWLTIQNLVMPNIYDDDAFIKNNFSLVYGSDDNEKFITNEYKDVLIVSRIERYLANAAHNVFPKADFKSACRLNTAPKENSIEIFFYPCNFLITVYKNAQLLFFKVKEYTTPADVLYFVLNVINQYELKKNVDIIAGGFINYDSKLFQLLYEYLENIRLEIIDETLLASDEFKEYPLHYFLPYINYLA